MLKYGEMFTVEIKKLIQQIFLISQISEGWEMIIVLPIFKKGGILLPENYKGINLLYTLPKTNQINKPEIC
jgi:hypothetical protein